MSVGKNRKKLLSIPVDAIDMQLALNAVDRLLQGNKKNQYIIAINPEKIIASQKNQFLRHMIENATLLIPDGIGVVWTLRYLYGMNVSRVPGADLMGKICEMSARKGRKVFIYGANEDVNRGATEKLRIMHKGINIVGRCNGYLPKEKMDNLVDQINESGADILFVALGSPRQEQWIHEYLPRLNVKLCQGIGGTLDTIVGTVERAPQNFQKYGFEWLYRLLKEPTRIRRQIIIPYYMMRVIAERIRA